MNLTGVQVAQLVADHLTAVYTANPLVSVERNYFPQMERDDYEKGEFKINVWPSAVNSVASSRGRGLSSRMLSRTIGVAIISRAESTVDSSDNDVYNQSTMDDYILFVEEVLQEVNGVASLTLEDIEDADYMDASTLESNQLLATSINVTYKDTQ